MHDKFLTKEYLETMDKYFRASNYLSTAQLYLANNPLLKTPLKASDVKKKIVGHWGTCPTQNFIYTHCNRVINKYDLNMLLVSGPGHGGNFFVGNSYLEETYSEIYPHISQDKKGLTNLCKQFSFAYGIASHVSPEAPGSINEGGELGYSLAHSFGAIMDNPNLIVTTIVGDGEAETGPLATSWHSNKFINPSRDGAVLPILNLNGYKISNPCVLARISKKELNSLFVGYGYSPIIVSGSNPQIMHRKMALAMDKCIETIKKIQLDARTKNIQKRPFWPMIILQTPKGWTGPKIVDGNTIENSFKAHQVPIDMTKPEHLTLLSNWLKSYHPEELFDDDYKLKDNIKQIIPKGEKRISANINANGGEILIPLKTPNIFDYEVKFNSPGNIKSQDMFVLGGYIRDVIKLNSDNNNYRVFGPDEAMSNRLYKIFEQEKRSFNANILPSDDNISIDGKIMDSYLSEHMCEGWLEGYLLTGRHGVFDTYEAFARVIDSMVSQHSKWLKVCRELAWRKPISSLNLILTSNVWQQDHNGFSHQDPGFLNHLASKSKEVINLYLPPDSNTLVATYDKCAKTYNKINAIVASKHPSYQWLNMEEASKELEKGIMQWDFACQGNTLNPEIILCSCGDTSTQESMACINMIKKYLPNLNIKYINVLDLMCLSSDHPSSLSTADFESYFNPNVTVIFNFHGYADLIKQLIYDRKVNFIINGYNEQGTITTPFDMRVRNKIDRLNLFLQILSNININKKEKDNLTKMINDLFVQHDKYIREHGVDMPEIANWNFNN